MDIKEAKSIISYCREPPKDKLDEGKSNMLWSDQICSQLVTLLLLATSVAVPSVQDREKMEENRKKMEDDIKEKHGKYKIVMFN